MEETVYSLNGCVFCPAGVVCEQGPSEARCGRCGWNPRIEAARKEQTLEKLRKQWKPRLRAATSSAAAAAPSPRGEGKGGGADV